jgi:protein-L-isoaspartate(D-aspartate) O-methyltransferase
MIQSLISVGLDQLLTANLTAGNLKDSDIEITAESTILMGWPWNKSSDSNSTAKDSDEMSDVLEPQSGPRSRMVELQLRQRGITDERILAAMLAVPRHRFVPTDSIGEAHGDHPVRIGHGQTVSQPHIVAMMSQLLADLPAEAKILEIGSGSGYQTAILVHMGFRVYAVERIDALASRAAALLKELELKPISLIVGNGHLGLSEFAPFDAIICAAAADSLPKAWTEQLGPNGRIIAPTGPPKDQWLRRWTKLNGGLEVDDICRVRFVPLVDD